MIAVVSSSVDCDCGAVRAVGVMFVVVFGVCVGGVGDLYFLALSPSVITGAVDCAVRAVGVIFVDVFIVFGVGVGIVGLLYFLALASTSSSSSAAVGVAVVGLYFRALVSSSNGVGTRVGFCRFVSGLYFLVSSCAVIVVFVGVIGLYLALTSMSTRGLSAAASSSSPAPLSSMSCSPLTCLNDSR